MGGRHGSGFSWAHQYPKRAVVGVEKLTPWLGPDMFMADGRRNYAGNFVGYPYDVNLY